MSNDPARASMTDIDAALTTGYLPARRLRGLATWLTNQAAMRAFQLSSKALATASSHPRDYALLASLVEQGPASQAELARRTGIDTSDVVAALRAMETRGEIARKTDRTDRRRNIVTATARGIRRLDKLDAVLAEAQATYLQALSPREQQSLLHMLERLADLPDLPPNDH